MLNDELYKCIIVGFIFFITFLIWPFGSVWLSLRNYSKKWTANIIWLFVIYYGYLFVLSNDTMDANRIKSKFEVLVYQRFSLSEVVGFFYLQKEDGVDIIQPIVFYVVSLFSENFQVLMAVLAAIFGYFYSRNIKFLLDRSNGRIKLYNYDMIWAFAFLIGFWQINAFRFWTSSLLFFYAVIPYVYENSLKRLWLLPLIPLLHFSFLFPIVVILIYTVFRNRPSFYFVLYLASFLLVSVNVGYIGELITSLLPSSFHSKVNAYANNEYAESLTQNVKSISFYLRYLMFFIINFIFTLFYLIERNEIKRDVGLYNLFNFCLLFMAASNYISVIPSGDRFVIVTSLFSLAFIFFYVQQYRPYGTLKIALNASVPLLLLGSIGFIRQGLTTINILAIVGNPVLAFLFDSKVALIEYFL